LYAAPELADPDNKFYMLVMFAYPSGDLHMGHFRNYIIGDAVARKQMMLGKDVLHPFGWDAFGLPAERAAIKRNIHPREWTLSNIGVSRRTLQRVGISYDWSREVNSCMPDYYKWTQWMFIQLFKKGLAYRKRGLVNWCPEDLTVLANEQVVDGTCERCGTRVEKKEQVQWYFKITAYADQLVDDLDRVEDWPENLISMQREWIGRSFGAEIDFIIEGTGEKLPIFTTRPDTIYGVTFMAIAPEAEVLSRLSIEGKYAEQVDAYCREATRHSDIDRAADADKDGVFTGKYAINPFSGERVQLWVADYVLAGYGTGAVMAVPAHDTRDFAFARKYNIPIRVVIHPDHETTLSAATMTEAFCEYGPMVNSGPFDGLAGEEAFASVIEYAERQQFGRKKVNYKLKDWLISRQRYWGAPIPIIHCPQCGEVPVEEKDLPVLLPHTDSFVPKGRSPLADVPAFMNVSCPKCGGEAKRDPDTMDTFVCSSWYYLRYIDPHNDKVPFDRDKVRRYLPIDLYVGGITHATGHLIYYRFFHKFLRDLGWVTGDEPTRRMFCLGMVLDGEGRVMSKSAGNVVSPMPLMEEHGVDVSRLAMFFTAPTEKEVLWSNTTLAGIEKFFFNRLCPLAENYRRGGPDCGRCLNKGALTGYERELYVKLNQTIRRCSEDSDKLQFNTVIAALMELMRDYQPEKTTSQALNDYLILTTIQLLAPLAPHLAEELWEQCGVAGSVFRSKWPEPDADALIGDTIEVAVQVNGKLRGSVVVPAGADQAAVEQAAFASDRVRIYTEGKQIRKKIFVKGRILNILVGD
jgi:leucyl-tRNA synthetase